MPYRDSVQVELINTGNQNIDIDLAEVEYESGPVSQDEGLFHAVFRQSPGIITDERFEMARIDGEGHYVGNLLWIRRDMGTNGTKSRNVLEGDDILVVNPDGEEPFTLYGTGLEDAYNGGYYYNHVAEVAGEPDGLEPASGVAPMHGLLYIECPEEEADGVDYDLTRADQYRWLLADAVPFTDGLQILQENHNYNDGAQIGSTVFYYSVPEPTTVSMLLVATIGLGKRMARRGRSRKQR